jgi:hypothetical protein
MIVLYYFFNQFTNNFINTCRNVTNKEGLYKSFKALWSNLLKAFSSLKKADKVNLLGTIDGVSNLQCNVFQPLGGSS